jgi:GDPmannose 4,6-dehydratase
VAASAKGSRTALITGISGQDGSFLAELLLEQGYRVWGWGRGDSLGAAEHLRGEIELRPGELLEPQTLTAAVAQLAPDELYHLAAPSFVPESWEHPSRTVAAIAGATAVLLEAVRAHSPSSRVFVATSSEVFGAARESPQREDTRCFPQTPYASAKLLAHQLVGQLRDRNGLFACSGILYNHESERRPDQFVSRKVTRSAAAIKLGLARELELGDLNAVRDWSFAGDVVRGAWLMLQREQPCDYVLASGAAHTVAELAEVAFGRLGMDYREFVRVEPSLVRPPEPVPLIGDPSRARERLGWRPTLGFEDLIARMVDADLRELEGQGSRPGL